MKKSKVILSYIESSEINENNINIFLSKISLTKKQLLDNTFEILNNLIIKLANGKDILLLEDIRKTINLVSFLCQNENFNDEEIKEYKKKIKHIRENILFKATLYDCKHLYESANKLDELILSKNISSEDLILLIKKLMFEKENINVIKKMIDINKSTITDSNELFNYVFDLACNAVKTNDRNIYYYITLLKLFYNSKINIEYYTNKLMDLDEECDEESFLYIKEMIHIVNGFKRPLNKKEILEKYKINSSLVEKNIYIYTPDENFDNSVFTIDKVNTYVRDDALSIKKDGNNYIVGIHIADVGGAIKPNGFLDIQAKNNLKCIYLDNSVRIFPNKCEKKLSLDKDTNKNVISLYVVLNSSGDLIDYYIKENNIIISDNLSFLQADRIMNSLNPNELTKNFNELFELATALQEKATYRKEYWKKKKEGKSNSLTDDDLYKSKQIINEFMILYNSLLGKIAKENKFPYIYRYQDEEYISSLIDELGIEINDAAKKIIGDIYLDSKYSSTPRWHEGMGIDHYTQSVDPIRKYPDLYTQYLLHKFYFDDLNFKFDEEEFENTIKYFNQRSQELVLMRSEYSREMRLERKSK